MQAAGSLEALVDRCEEGAAGEGLQARLGHGIAAREVDAELDALGHAQALGLGIVGDRGHFEPAHAGAAKLPAIDDGHQVAGNGFGPVGRGVIAEGPTGRIGALGQAGLRREERIAEAEGAQIDLALLEADDLDARLGAQGQLDEAVEHRQGRRADFLAVVVAGDVQPGEGPRRGGHALGGQAGQGEAIMESVALLRQQFEPCFAAAQRDL